MLRAMPNSASIAKMVDQGCKGNLSRSAESDAELILRRNPKCVIRMTPQPYSFGVSACLLHFPSKIFRVSYRIAHLLQKCEPGTMDALWSLQAEMKTEGIDCCHRCLGSFDVHLFLLVLSTGVGRQVVLVPRSRWRQRSRVRRAHWACGPKSHATPNH